jgi:choloylglycine hydrolase
MTNAPTYDWHTTNLRNYVNVPPIKMAGETFKQLGQGSGMLGLRRQLVQCLRPAVRA